ncbi:hypothetical protein GCM10025866_14280 [Naasia aerilata]|uniref:GAF domain-containing protein n=1 Tax=Naasia aerilata TaxID=1162966 RepID=A0ABN6XKX8_9MICO|nr:hypothetical protein GCM10025866_14280 [Naasia aerilata]
MSTGRRGADRVLLVGNGPAHGWGVASHQLSLPGALGRSFTRRTGRGCDVDFVGEELMSMGAAVPWLGNRDLEPYDLAVVVIGMSDAVRLTRLEDWERDLDALLRHLHSGLRKNVRTVIAGIQTVASVPPYRGLFAVAGQRHADRLNTVTARAVAATGRDVFLPMPEPTPELGRPFGSPRMYEGLADAMTATAAPLLDEVRAGEAERRESMAGAVKWRWAGAERVMQAAGTRGTPRLQALTQRAKEQFGVQLSAVTLLNDDRLWFAAASAGTPVSIPAELSYCVHALRTGAPLVVPNALSDERFRHNEFINLSHLPFYAGVPLHSLAGDPIGMFCLLAAQPRGARTVSLDALQAFAREAEAELQGLELEADLAAR